MARASVIAAFVLSVLAPSGSASANDCTCFAVPDDVRAALEQSIEVGPFFSSDGTMLSSHDLERVSAHLERERRLPAGEILWCWSSNDPRCSPNDSAPDEGPRAPRTSPGAGLLGDDAAPWPEPDADALATALRRGDGPREGVRSRVDRPPRV